MATRSAPRPTLLGVLWHALRVVGIVMIVAVMWLLVTYPRGVLAVLGGWIIYRVARMIVFAFRHDARRSPPDDQALDG